MTDSHRFLPPHLAPSTTDRILSASPALVVPDARPAVASTDEEPYTIKCVCEFTDDDGNTIYCEECDSWQHIECYYPGNVDDATRDDFDHQCVDCRPRVVDGRQATERQRRQRQTNTLNETSDKKVKRPLSKNHKKPLKPSDQVNGNHPESISLLGLKNGLAESGPKKKPSHRSQHSISSQSAKRSPSYSGRPKHPLSPATTPPDLPDDLQLHTYSDHFIKLYDQDPGDLELKHNTYVNLKVSDKLSSWLREPQADLGVDSLSDIVPTIKPEVDFSKHPWPPLDVKSSKGSTGEPGIRWRYLVAARTIHQKEGLVGELKGMIGFQKEYCNADSETYARTCHPAPFVFFHTRLPIYIDTRQEGSRCRYIRRSCRPNTTLEAYLYHGSEYRFCITADRTIKAEEQITLPWDFRFKNAVRDRYLHLLGLADDDADHGPDRASEGEYLELSELVYNVLSDHGGCACGLGNDCAFMRLHRNYHSRSQSQPASIKPKKARRPKQHLSPNSTGQATNSRATSEGHVDHDGEDDVRSTSGSVRSKPHSRDITPLANGPSDVPSLELSDREKRKLAAIEESFQKIEQPRKKKRASDGSSASNHGTNHVSAANKARQKSASRSLSHASPANVSRPRQYVDASTSRPSSSSPHRSDGVVTNGRSPSMQPSEDAGRGAWRQPAVKTMRPSSYVDHSTQTVEDNRAWYHCATVSPKVYVSLRQRLLQNRQVLKRDFELKCKLQQEEVLRRSSEPMSSPSSVSNREVTLIDPERASAGPPMTDEDPASSPGSASTSGPIDVHMADATSPVMSIKPPPPPWPNETTTAQTASATSERRVADLRIQMPAPSLFNSQAVTINGLGSATSTSSGSVVQSPLGTPSLAFSPSISKAIAPLITPTKTKKLSLSDYKARLKKGPEPSQLPVKPSHRSPVLEPTAMSGIEPVPMTDVIKEPAGADAAIDTDELPSLPSAIATATVVSADTM